LKVRSYIILLTIGSLAGAFSIAGFGWFAFQGLNSATEELESESRKTGISSDEFGDVNAFLETTRRIFESMDIYPENYTGLFSVVLDDLVLAKEGLNILAEKYYKNYSEDLLQGIAKEIKEVEKNILKMQQDGIATNVQVAREGNNPVNSDYNKARESLSQNLNILENDSKTNLAVANKALQSKWEDLESRKEGTAISLIIAVVLYLAFVFTLAFLTYKSFALPVANLEEAARRSIEKQQPFVLGESGPLEIRSLTKRLQGLIIGLESTVKNRTAKLQEKTNQLKLEIQQRKELETQLVHAQKMEAVGQLASGIAHEINSPSQFANDNILFLKEAVEGFIAKLDNTENAPDEKELSFLKGNASEAAEQAKEGISRITTIVKSMKNFAYRDAESAKKPNDLNQAIESTIVVATNEWKYHAEIKKELDENLPMVPCNIGEINQVVLNLIVNGAHAIRDRDEASVKGEIKISTKHYPSDDCVVISITDNGGGIPQQVQERIFEPFFTTKEVGVGTGQGLAIAHNVVVKSHNGQIWFQSVENQGTTFFIKLPMTQ
tara:strand:- start:362 stop:2014 length:1653 start_codon:yes stop_codon:yes gene_type:complete